MDRFVHKLKKVNKYSYSLTIPKDFIDKYGWRDKQKITIKDKGRGLLEVRDWKNG